MKTLFQCVVLLCLTLTALLPAAGQITIVSSDVSAYFVPGTSTTSRIDTGTHTINIGTLGATSWDFSGLTVSYSATTVAVRPDTTAFYSFYPAATHAIKVGTGYSYYTLSANLLALGFAQGPPTAIRSKDIPAQVIEQLPMTMGTIWTATYTDSTYVTIGGTTYPSRTDHVVDYTVDAYGSLTLPGGNVYQALRLKTDRHATTNSISYRSITYQFVTKEGAAFSVVPSDTNQPQTGSISVSNSSWNLASGATSVEEIPSGAVPASFALGQNYPNPFNPSTTIHFSVAHSAFVTVKVYNLLGQELATLVSEQLAPGTYSTHWDGSGFPSGVYVYRLRAGTFVETKRLVLLK